jgi:hypothetical protein
MPGHRQNLHQKFPVVHGIGVTVAGTVALIVEPAAGIAGAGAAGTLTVAWVCAGIVEPTWGNFAVLPFAAAFAALAFAALALEEAT